MSTPNLDKTLDDIIGSNKIRSTKRHSRNKKKAASGGVTKKAATPKKKDVTKLKDEGADKGRKRQAASKADDPFYQAVKATISNFPVDITESKLKEFLSNDIGPVKTCEGVYARNGKPTGKFIVEFHSEGKALATFNKLNGMPMDNGAKILAVEINTDPNRKSLASRLGATTPAKKDQKKGQQQKKQEQPKQKKPKKKAPKKRTVPKSAEELDAEMDEYISQKDVISV